MKNGKQYVIFDYKDKAGKRKRKWVSTGLPEKCTKKALNEAVEKIVAEFVESWNNCQVVLNNTPKSDGGDAAVINKELNDFFFEWLTAIKANAARTTVSQIIRVNIIPMLR